MTSDPAQPDCPPHTALVVGFPGALGAGLRAALDGDHDLRVIGDAKECDVRRLITQHGPHVVLVGLSLFASTMELRRLVVDYPAIGIVVGVPRPSRRRDDALLAAGARVVMPLTMGVSELRAALKLVAQRMVGPPRVDRVRPAEEVIRLTEREYQVFDHLLRQRASQDIADELGIAISTVHTHTRRIYEKLGVHSRAELVAYASDLPSDLLP